MIEMGTVRWKYTSGSGLAEIDQRQELERRITSWWKAFEEKVEALNDLFSRRGDWDLPAWMSETLQAVDSELMWEYGPAVRGEGHRLVITPETHKDLRPLVGKILAEAPALSGWEFYGHRLPESLEMARMTVEARCGQPSRLSEVLVARGDHNRIDLAFSGKDVEKDTEAAAREAFVLAEALLGEQVLDCWIGAIEVRPRPKRGFLSLVGSRDPAPDSVPLEKMQEVVDAAIGDIRGSAMDMTGDMEAATWSLLELKPEGQDDYPQQADLFVAKTPNIDLWRATREDAFYDARFGGSGEIFAYLKLDGSEGTDGEKFADKSEIEDALDTLLIPQGWGRQLGGGTGLRYSYIELVLTDLTRAIPAIQKLLTDGNIPKRSWLLFHGCEQATEWIGIYDDSPVPP